MREILGSALDLACEGGWTATDDLADATIRNLPEPRFDMSVKPMPRLSRSRNSDGA